MGSKLDIFKVAATLAGLEVEAAEDDKEEDAVAAIAAGTCETAPPPLQPLAQSSQISGSHWPTEENR